jgi:ABC-type antimicrobial peptide transport system permease subunit
LYAVDAYVTYFNGDRFPKEYLSASLSDVLEKNVPEIEQMTRIAEREYAFISGDKTFIENGLYADENFFKVFSFPLKESDGRDLLTDPNSIIISERMAANFFGSSDCTGKTLIIKDESKHESYKVAAVFKDVPCQSLLQFDFVISFSKFLTDNTWALETGATANETWILLKKNADSKIVGNKIRDLIKNQETTLNQELFLFPLGEKILYSYAGGRRVWNEMQNLVIIGSIGFAILLIACFNFINLAIALNFRRYKEAGVKKVAGSDKSVIIIQFLGETFIISIISLLAAVVLVSLLLPLINIMLNFDIHFRMTDFSTIAFFIAITLFTALCSGLMPALFLASTNPVNALKGKLIAGNSYSIFRQSLIVFQFAIPVVLIICMMIIRTQDNYMRNYDAGVEKDNVIVLNNTINIQNHNDSFKAELYALPGVEAVSFTNCIPTRNARVSSEVSWEGKDASEKLHFWCINTDYDYNKAVRINIFEGRFFSPSFSTDSTAYLINDVAAGVMKSRNPVGSVITVDGQKGTIIGMFKDFHAIDLAGPLVPSIMEINPGFKPVILIKYSSGTFQDLSAKISAIFRHYEPDASFNAILFGDLAPSSNLSLPSKLTGLAFIIALLLACLGLFGLSSFTAENRTKEIGIRKVNGATTFLIVRLLLRSYTRWLVLAFLIAVPIAFILGKNFLGRFYFHSPVPLWAFIAGPLIAFLVALLTISSQTWKIASHNPVKSLRYE